MNPVTEQKALPHNNVVEDDFIPLPQSSKISFGQFLEAIRSGLPGNVDFAPHAWAVVEETRAKLGLRFGQHLSSEHFTFIKQPLRIFSLSHWTYSCYCQDCHVIIKQGLKTAKLSETYFSDEQFRTKDKPLPEEYEEKEEREKKLAESQSSSCCCCWAPKPAKKVLPQSKEIPPQPSVMLAQRRLDYRRDIEDRLNALMDKIFDAISRSLGQNRHPDLEVQARTGAILDSHDFLERKAGLMFKDNNDPVWEQKYTVFS